MWCKQTASSSTASWVHLKIVTAALWVSTAALRFSQGCRQLAKMEHRDIHLAARARNDGQNCPARRPARARAAPLWTPKSSGGGGACRGNGGDGRRVRGRAVGLCVCSCACVRARMRACVLCVCMCSCVREAPPPSSLIYIGEYSRCPGSARKRQTRPASTLSLLPPSLALSAPPPPKSPPLSAVGKTSGGTGPTCDPARRRPFGQPLVCRPRRPRPAADPSRPATRHATRLRHAAPRFPAQPPFPAASCLAGRTPLSDTRPSIRARLHPALGWTRCSVG